MRLPPQLSHGGPLGASTGLRPAVGVLLVVLVAALLPVQPAQGAAPAVPAPSVALPAEVDIIDAYQAQKLCDPTPKPGALKLRDTLWRTYGSSIWAGISRDCGASGSTAISEHKDGRAIDWGVSIRNASRAAGDRFAAWAVANNGENARRMGIMYIIWDSKMWRTYGMDRGWTEYNSCQSVYTSTSYDTTCHRDHLHISMTWHGAGAETSWFDGTAVVRSKCAAGASVGVQPGSSAAPSAIFDPMAGIGTRNRCYLDSSIQSVKVPITAGARSTVQHIRVTQLTANAPSPVKIWTNGGSSVAIRAGTATPATYSLRMGTDAAIYFQQPVGQSQIKVEGLGQSVASVLGAGQTLPIAVVGAKSGVPGSAKAVSLNVTVTQPERGGYITVFPCGRAVPGTSTLNFAAGQTVANSVIVGVGDGGRVCAYSTSTAHLVVDLGGHFPAGSAFAPVAPVRVLDTRTGAGAKLAAGQDAAVAVPAGAGAIALNLTITQPAGPGWALAYPCGTALPSASTVNFAAGVTVPNSALVKAGSGGKVCVRTSTSAHVIVDMTGTLPSGAGFTPVAPQRLVDTRTAPGTRAAAGTDVVVPVPGAAGAAALNLTVTAPAGPGWVLAYPCGSAPPVGSSVNYVAGATVANGTIVKVGPGGKVCLRTSATTHVIADLGGTFAPGSTLYQPATPIRLLDTRQG